MPKAVPELAAQFWPQAWNGDNAEPAGDTVRFDAAPYVLAMNAGDFKYLVMQMQRSSGRDLDTIGYHSGLQAERAGAPFEVRIDEADWFAWLEEVGLRTVAVEEINDAVMDRVREPFGVELRVEPGMTLLAQTSVADWRMPEGSDDELSDMQKQSWPVRIYQSTGGGVELEFDAPDGTQRIVAFEIDKGNLKILPSRDRGAELDAIIVVEPGRIHAAHFGGKGAVAFDQEGVMAASESPEASFAADASPRP